MIDPASMAGDTATIEARAVLGQLNTALTNGDAEALTICFYTEQAFWKDQLALTYHLRTFSSPGVIAASLLETAKLRDLGRIEAVGPALFLPVSPVLVRAKVYPYGHLLTGSQSAIHRLSHLIQNRFS